MKFQYDNTNNNLPSVQNKHEKRCKRKSDAVKRIAQKNK